MLTTIKNQIEQFHMLDEGDKVLIGLSGGADSVCLTEVLYLLREEYKISLCAVHCHHGIRGIEADEDALFAQNFCKERGIPFFYVEEKVEERAQKEKISTEEAGRMFRYETFWRLMEQEGCNKIAVAHNANDRAETMLFHLARGTGLAGLSSMEPLRKLSEGKMLIRPLLRTERRQIEEWLSERKIGFRTDKTNLSDIYTRNRIRHHILPEMKEINQQAVHHMGQTAENIGEALQYLKFQEEQAREYCVVRENEKKIMIQLKELFGFHSYLIKSILYHCLAEISDGRKDLERIHVKLLQELAEGESGRSISLPGGVRAKKEYDKLVLYREEKRKTGGQAQSKEEKKSVQEMELDFRGDRQWTEQNLDINVQKFSFEGQEISKKKYTKFFDCDKIENGLRLRFWQPGDYLYLREDGGKKKLNRFFIDQKIPQEERESVLLLADGNHILWIIGYRISAYYKVTAETKNVLSVTIKNKG